MASSRTDPPRPPQAARLGWVLFALALAIAPLVFDSRLALTLLSQAGIAIVACLSFNLLMGQGGMLSFGHAVYTGLGAYAAIHALAAVSAGRLPLPVALLPLAGGLAGLAVALPFGLVATRRGGTPFAMITLGLGELVAALAPMFPSVFGGEGGISGDRVVGAPVLGLDWGPPAQLYGLIAAYTFACAWAMHAFTRTPLGRMLNAVRDNPERVAALGYSPQQLRWRAFAIAGFFGGVAGGLHALHFEIVTPEALGTARSASYLVFTFIGGAGHFAGPIVGGVLMVLSSVLLSTWTPAWQLYLGLLFLAMVMWAPGGIAGLAAAALRLAARGGWRPLAPAGLALAAAALPAALGAAALVEMIYHLQLESALGPRLAFLGVTLDTGRPSAWLGAVALLLAGAALTRAARRRCLKCQRHEAAAAAGSREAP
ncbi:branched-chain amino acid ABC transporter permease [Caldimonas tepidiphila]|uniref:branched-chain amino acid ABC transporter permease n=1 Tax=Caldimonas tepidiphila TaxID=2315841 RepID=UPI000E5B7EDA|nr:branched-chain amino acid ABC transporter permease [Caldimonas tepidiphila]